MGRIAAIDLRRRSVELASNLLDRHLGAGCSGLESRHRRHLLPARPIHRRADAFVSIDDDALVGRHINADGPGILVAALNRQLMMARGNQQFLLPTPLVVKFVAVANIKYRGILAIQEDGGTVGTFQRNASPRPRNVPGYCLHRNVEDHSFMRLDRYRAGFGLKSVVVQIDFVLTRRETNVVTFRVHDRCAVSVDMSLRRS